MDAFSFWPQTELTARFLHYLAIALLAGMFHVSLLVIRDPATTMDRLRRGSLFMLALTVLGAMAAAAQLLLQVGAINQAGLPGMLDPLMLSILWQSPSGVALQFKLLGFVLSFTGLCWLLASGRFSSAVRLGGFRLLALLAVLSLVASFAFYGHLLEQGWLARLAVSAHALAVLLWAGSLLPLYRETRLESGTGLIRVMQRFGRLAMIKLGVMLVTGVYVLSQLLDPLSQLYTTGYGLLLALKLLLVLALTGFAALNRFRLVEGLRKVGSQEVGSQEVGSQKRDPARALRLSIMAEIVLVTGVLGITAVLTTLLGPDSMM